MRQYGFTLIELIIVIIIIAVLAVSVIPRLSSTDDYDSLSQRNQALSLLRLVQQQAMQDTLSQNKCYEVRFSTNELGLAAQLANGSCATSGLINISSGSSQQHLRIEDLSNYSIVNSSSASISAIEFDNWGRPTPNTGSCATSGCVLTIDNYSLCIESEGYIHDC